MGDFLLDFRDRSRRRTSGAPLQFYPDMGVDRISREAFSLFVSRAGSKEMWAPYECSDGVVVALAGRLAFDEGEWKDAAQMQGDGGLACKAVYRAYRERGVDGLRGLNGAFAVHLYDPVPKLYYVVTDRAGAYPAYTDSNGEVFSSHPDVLATCMDHADWDVTSMAQFIGTGVVTHPWSYYRRISALEFGCVHRLALDMRDVPKRSIARYASAEPDSLSTSEEGEMADRLAQAIIAASRRRTLPVLGRTAIALSGGLDSRAIVCGAERHSALFAFCAFDEQNAEYRSAKAIADALDVELVPFRRTFDHYGDNAEMGVRISGGMGELSSNHFLGFRERLRELGMDNLVTGCYFDYLFKSLSLDVRETWLLRRERLANFSHESYLPHFAVGSGYQGAVRDRLEALFQPADCSTDVDLGRARLAARRTFPLYREGDNAQRLVPMRTMGWHAPATDPVVLELARTTPPWMKLNRRVYLNAVRRICGEAISRIPDANTGLPLYASQLRVACNRYRIALRRRLERRGAKIATDESWPNWTYYIRASAKISALWRRPNRVARELLGEVSGELFREDVASYLNRPTQYFIRLLTLKLWLDQRDRAD